MADGLFTRFTPDKPGNLAAGGRLQALAIDGLPGMDTRNWDRVSFAPGAAPSVRWVDLDAVDNPADDLRKRGRAAVPNPERPPRRPRDVDHVELVTRRCQRTARGASNSACRTTTAAITREVSIQNRSG